VYGCCCFCCWRRRRGDEEEEVSLGLIMTNTEIFHIFHINSLFKGSCFIYVICV
jgi:hypothetical protein